MNLETVLTFVHDASAIAMIVAVVLQSRGSGMGQVFGGGGGGTFKARRGTEAVLFNSTIILAIVFAVSAIAVAILNVRTS